MSGWVGGWVEEEEAVSMSWLLESMGGWVGGRAFMHRWVGGWVGGRKETYTLVPLHRVSAPFEEDLNRNRDVGGWVVG